MSASADTYRVPGENALRRVFGAVGFLLDAARRRRAGRRTLWGVVVAMALAGTMMIAYPFVTHLWASRIQSGLERQIVTPAARVAYENQTIKVGSAVTRLKIPRLRVNIVVVEGVTGNALRAGAGHYPNTALPGGRGNVAIAGHRTGFGQPFRHLERMRSGDEIVLETPLGKFVYEVLPSVDGHENPWITNARDWRVVQPTSLPSLTLTTCDPPGTSKNRLIVRARLVSQTSTA